MNIKTIYIKSKLKYNMKKSELKRLVEQKVNEAWYNNIDDFYHGVGKCATYGAIGTAATIGGANLIDKGLENNDKYQETINQQSRDMQGGTDADYMEWCNAHNLNPNSKIAIDQYDDMMNDKLQESKIKRIVRRALVESIALERIKQHLKQC